MLRKKRLGVITASTLISAGALLGISMAPAGAVAASPQTAMASTATHSSDLTGRNIPGIRFAECTNERTTWVDIDMIDLVAGLIQDWCFGYTRTGRQTWIFTGNWNITNFCAGNNYGTLRYRTPRGVYLNLYFLPGELHGFQSGTRPITLKISGFIGHDTCIS